MSRVLSGIHGAGGADIGVFYLHLLDPPFVPGAADLCREHSRVQDHPSLIYLEFYILARESENKQTNKK